MQNSLPVRWAWIGLNALQLAYTALWTAFCVTLALLVLAVTWGCQRVPLRMAAWLWAPGLLYGAGARLDVSGLDRVDFARPCVCVANHQSMIDVCALLRALPVPVRFMLKEELGKVPFIGWYARAMGMVFIPRGRARAAARRQHRVIAGVRVGACLCAFPEGTRSLDGEVGAFKGGAFEVVIAAGAPVVPIALAGSGRVLPASGFRVRQGRIRVCIGDPIPTVGLGAHDRHALAQKARDAVTALLAAGQDSGRP